MSLDATAREANIRDSIKKFFIDNLYSKEGIELTFDRGLATPKIPNRNLVEKWVSVNFGLMDRETLSTHSIMIYCCTRKDSEGFKLAQLVDTVMGYLSDTTETDGMKRIPFYRSKAQGDWDLLGSLLVQDVIESNQMIADDETKFKILTVKLRWATKI